MLHKNKGEERGWWVVKLKFKTLTLPGLKRLAIVAK
jgi:hypothetical protein